MKSLRARFLIAGLSVLVLFSFLTLIALSRAFYESALHAQEDKMKGMIYALLGLIDEKPNGDLALNELGVGDPRFLTPHSGLIGLIFDDAEKVIWKSPSAGTESGIVPVDTPTGQWFWSTSREGFFQLGYGVTWQKENGTNQKFTMVVSENKKAFEGQIRFYRKTLWRWLLATTVVVLIAFYLVLRWGLKPLQTVTEELDTIQKGKQELIEKKYPVELVPLTQGLNSLLRHERSQQKRFRNALDDLAHSLKTPLAVLRGLGDARASEQIAHIDKVLDYQVRRASMAGRNAFAPPISIRNVVDKIVSALSKVYREKSLQYEVIADESLTLSMDEGDMMEVFGNLLDNASKWANSKVRLEAVKKDHAFALQIEDDGKGFPKDNREQLLERGVRADRRVPGEGIGLSVVQTIVSLYEGTIALSDSPLGGGKVLVIIPF
jgi:two-component system, OmpR family, sensor histidine kinase PhoQ